MRRGLGLVWVWLGLCGAGAPMLRVSDGAGSVALELVEARATVVLRGHLIRTAWELGYRNAQDRELEGDFYFPLPPGARVSDLALDFDGVKRHAVSVERDRGRLAYDTVVHRRVDPALAEWAEGNTFRIRVYPIPARGVKKVWISYDQEAGLSHALDLRWGAQLERFGLWAEGTGGWRVAEAEGLPLRREGAAWSGRQSNAVLDARVEFVRPEPGAVGLTEPEPGTGRHFASISLPLEPPPAEGLPPAERVVLLWDASGSAAGQDRARLLGFLAGFLGRQSSSARLTLIPFHARVEAAREFSGVGGAEGFGELALALSGLPSSGATDLAGLLGGLPELARGWPAGARVVLVSDGLDTLNPAGRLREAVAGLGSLGVPLLCVQASEVADARTLRRIAGLTRGWALELTGQSTEAALLHAMERPRWVQASAPWGGLSELTPGEAVAYEPGLRLRLAGMAEHSTLRNGRLRLEWSGGAQSRSEVVAFSLEEAGAPAGLARGAWAGARLEELLSSNAAAAEIEELGRKFKMLTPRTSLIVLERWQDYQEFGVEMPPDVKALRNRGRWEYKMWRRMERRNQRKGSSFLLPPASPVATPMPGTNPTWTLHVRVEDFEGGPLPGVTVTLKRSGVSSPIEKVTGENGGTSFELKELASFKIEAQLASFQPVRRVFRQAFPNSGSTLVMRMWLESLGEALMVTAEAAPPTGQQGGLLRARSIGFGSEVNPVGAELEVLIRACLKFFFRNPARAVFRSVSAALGPDWDFFVLAPWNIILRWEWLREVQIWSTPLFVQRFLLDAVAFEIGHGARGEELPALYRAARRYCPGTKELCLRSALAFRRRGDSAWAVRALTDLLEFAPDEPGLGRLVGLILDGWGEAGLARKVLERSAGQQGLRAPRQVQEVDPDAGLIVRLDWDTLDTDIDLHVIEPGGQEVDYGRREGAAGSRLLEDVQDGYGPELYWVKRPPAGRYRAEVAFYAEDAVDVDSASLALLTVEKRDPATGRLGRKVYPLVLAGSGEHVPLAWVDVP